MNKKKLIKDTLIKIFSFGEFIYFKEIIVHSQTNKFKERYILNYKDLVSYILDGNYKSFEYIEDKSSFDSIIFFED